MDIAGNRIIPALALPGSKFLWKENYHAMTIFQDSTPLSIVGPTLFRSKLMDTLKFSQL